MSKVTEFFKKPFFRRYANYLTISFVVLLFAVFSLSGVKELAKPSTLYLLEKIGIAMVLALSLSMVVGFLGELSLGHAGFMCAGAYVGGKLSTVLVSAMGAGDSNLAVMLVALLAGGMVAALFGFLIGLPALRLRGDYLAIVTLAFGEIIRNVVMNLPASWFGGTLGLETPRFNRNQLFIIVFLMVLACLAVTQNLIRSKHGRAIISIKDNEIAARAMGIDVTKYKLFVFVISSFFAGIAGVLYSYSNYTVQSGNFDYNYSIEILVMVVLGGMGAINGSMIAAALITFLNVKLQTSLTGDLAVMKDLVYALILILIVIYRNAPSLKNFRERYNLNTLGVWLKKRLGGKKAEENAEQEVAEHDGQ